jgi:osmotically-inducible protein OsmY
MNRSKNRDSPTGRAALVLGCLLAPALMACHPGANAPEVTGTTGAGVPEAQKRSPLHDADIAQAIARHFHEEGLLRSEPVQVAVTQGVAVLSGSVSNLLAKERVASVTESIRGVRSVVDQVTVVPVARTDEQLETDVTRALQRDIATRAYPIAVSAKEADVTLAGTADSWQQKKLFADVAETVPGVKALHNAVIVHSTFVRNESEIAADVKYRIANDLWLDGNTLGVKVSGKTVHVTGVVASVAQKSRARSDGWVAGVDEVDDAGVVVDWSARDDQKRVTDYPVLSDSEIGKAVHAAFLLDPRLKTLMPQAAVQSGVVVLTGTVDSPKARHSAESDAKDTVGVWGVHDDVVVQPSGKLTDIDIERGVKRALTEDLFLPEGKSIQVSSVKGKVALKGTIASGYELFDVAADVQSVPGVAEVVEDDLIVKRPPAEIKADVEDRMFWDPMVQRDLVHVDVAADGVTTLTGTLDAWSEIKAAADDALLGGAARVINLLKLKTH